MQSFLKLISGTVADISDTQIFITFSFFLFSFFTVADVLLLSGFKISYFTF